MCLGNTNSYFIQKKMLLKISIEALVVKNVCSVSSSFLGRQKETLEWPARQKIAVGAARGLRYLHEECRVGCIVHRDMRPNNILITHDNEPLVCINMVLLIHRNSRYPLFHMLFRPESTLIISSGWRFWSSKMAA